MFNAFISFFLTHWGRNKMPTISQTTLSSAFTRKKMSVFRLKFHRSLFLRVQLTIFQHFQIMAWRRPGDKPLSEAMKVSLLTHICVARPQWFNDYNDIWCNGPAIRPSDHIICTPYRLHIKNGNGNHGFPGFIWNIWQYKVQAFQTHNHTNTTQWERLIFPIWKQDQLKIYPTKHIGVVGSELWG